MQFLETYTQNIRKKDIALQKMLTQDVGVKPIFDMSLPTLMDSKEAFNQAYEYLTCRFDGRMGVDTRVGQTGFGPVFLRHQALEARGDLVDESLAYRYELYMIKALQSLKMAFDYIDSFVVDRRSDMKAMCHRQFLLCQTLMEDNDGEKNITDILANFNHVLGKSISSETNIDLSTVKSRMERLSIWSGVDFPAHDIVTIDDTDDTFEINASISSPNLPLMVEMGIILFKDSHNNDNPSNEELIVFINTLISQHGNELSYHVSMEDIQAVKKERGEQLLDWYHKTAEDNQAVIKHYASQFFSSFMSVPVLLSEDAHGGKKTSFPSPMRAFHAVVNGWIKRSGNEKEAIVSNQSFRSGAAARLGDKKVTLANTDMVLAATDAFSKDAFLSSAALVTDVVTKAKKSEPDTQILDAHEEVEKIHSPRFKLKISSVIFKNFSHYIGRKIQHDRFNMRGLFNDLALHENNLLFKHEIFGKDLLDAYKAVQQFSKMTMATRKKDFPQREEEMKGLHKRIEVLLQQLKKAYASTKDVSLLDHIRLLESFHTYNVLEINHTKKSLFGKKVDPVIETVVEHCAQRGKGKMENQHYQQWQLALESIIGSHFNVLNQVSVPDDDADVKTKKSTRDIITHYYCKDGRDRTGITAMLIKTLNKMFDSTVSTLANRRSPPQIHDILPMSMLPTSNLDKTTALFRKTHDRVVADASSALLCGSPQSAMGDYGLLSKLFGAGGGIVSSVIPPIREGVRRLMLPIAQTFAKHLSKKGKFSPMFEIEPAIHALTRYLKKLALTQNDSPTVSVRNSTSMFFSAKDSVVKRDAALKCLLFLEGKTVQGLTKQEKLTLQHGKLKALMSRYHKHLGAFLESSPSQYYETQTEVTEVEEPHVIQSLVHTSHRIHQHDKETLGKDHAVTRHSLDVLNSMGKISLYIDGMQTHGLSDSEHKSLVKSPHARGLSAVSNIVTFLEKDDGYTFNTGGSVPSIKGR